MDIPTPLLAVVIAVLSLVLSIHTSISTRRSSQLQRLAAIRTKLSALTLKIHFDLSPYERCAKEFDQFLDDKEMSFQQDISILKENMAAIGELKSTLDSVSSTLSKFPFSLRAGLIDEAEHRVDSITQAIDIASEKLLPRMLKLVERIEFASGKQRSELPSPSINVDAAR